MEKINVIVEDTEDKEPETPTETSDTSPEEDAASVAGQTVPVGELERLRQEAEQARDRMLRAAAEFENYKKRAEREKQEYTKYVAESFVKDLLPVLDNLERALASATEDASNESIREGVSMIRDQLMDVLKGRNVQKIEASGQPFDPTYHEAVAKLPSDEPEDTVIEVFQNGYLLHERVIRPVRVVVSQGPVSDGKE